MAETKPGDLGIERRTPAAGLLIFLFRIYQRIGSPFLGGHCRFEPSCSNYAIEAVKRHGAVRGGWMATRRIARCRPGGGSGIDEVPED
ncbi:MAG: membrane protein insertion efficiency factor YidD [Phycisphaerales bacterium]|jgi:putative membrane protein insertion efficiency factor|nr:membrane protein insertion efficiency factor YidD [Phycisphaerales bacterium]